VSRAGAFDLEVPDGTLRIYGCEREVACLKVVSSKSSLHSGVLGTVHAPTLEVASVKLFKVVDLPLEGFPTRPIRGSRGILRVDAGI